MAVWTEETWYYSAEDVSAYHDPLRINTHFGLPLPERNRVFSLRMTTDGTVMRNPSKSARVSKKGVLVLGGDFGNLFAYRRIKSEHSDAWIWAERYTFTKEPAVVSGREAQDAFITALGKERLTEIERKARAAGLDPGRKTKGRPDLAVFLPNIEPQWRFIELKMLRDGLSDEQNAWLALLAEEFGRQSVILAKLLMASSPVPRAAGNKL